MNEEKWTVIRNRKNVEEPGFLTCACCTLMKNKGKT